MAGSADDRQGSLAALTGMSLNELTQVDDALLEEALERLVHAAGAAGDRLWSQGGCVQ
jgi:hypothetical protein